MSYTVSAFLDNTELYTGATNTLAMQLNMTTLFYRFTNIKVNDDKAVLLTTDKTAADSDGNIMLLIDGHEVKFKVIAINKEVQFLGIYFNMEGKKAQLIKQLRNIVRLAVVTMNRKRITPDHVIYLFNKVLIFWMEYLI